MNALSRVESGAVAIHTFQDMQHMAEAIAQSGLFGMKSVPQALALMFVAQAEGQHPASITQEYDIIQGKATRKTNSVLARFQAAGGKVEWHTLNHQIADATFSHPSGGSLRLDWTLEQAKTAGLANKDNWKGYSRAMLRARVIAEGVRAVYPAAIGGMLVNEEAQDLDLQPATAPAAPKNMGAAEVVETAVPATWPADAFAAQFERWKKAVEAGMKSVDDILAIATSKGMLTPEQDKQIRALKPADGANAAQPVQAQEGGAA